MAERLWSAGALKLFLAPFLAMLIFACAYPALAGWSDRSPFGSFTPYIKQAAKRAAIKIIRQRLYDIEDGPLPAPSRRAPAAVPGANAGGTPALQPTPTLQDPPETDAQVSADQAQLNPVPEPDSLPHVQKAFRSGKAGTYSPSQLVESGSVVLYPMKGGIWKRTDDVKYIILHSTETASPADAKRVIQSWSNKGQRHPGTQYVIDRDGTIYATTDPNNVTVHVNNGKTKPGFKNENSIGIEIVRSGKQKYTDVQMQSVVCLVSYLQQRFKVTDGSVVTHGFVQPSDRSDPVGFNLMAFNQQKDVFNKPTIARKTKAPPERTAVPLPAPDLLGVRPVPAAAPSLTLRFNH